MRYNNKNIKIISVRNYKGEASKFMQNMHIQVTDFKTYLPITTQSGRRVAVGAGNTNSTSLLTTLIV